MRLIDIEELGLSDTESVIEDGDRFGATFCSLNEVVTIYDKEGISALPLEICEFLELIRQLYNVKNRLERNGYE